MAMSGMSRTLALRSAEAPILASPLSIEGVASARFCGGGGGGTGSTALIVAFRGRGSPLILSNRAKRGIPLFLNSNRRAIPRFARFDSSSETFSATLLKRFGRESGASMTRPAFFGKSVARGARKPGSSPVHRDTIRWVPHSCDFCKGGAFDLIRMNWTIRTCNSKGTASLPGGEIRRICQRL